MSAFSEFFKLTESRNVNYRVEKTDGKSQMFFTNPNTGLDEAVTELLSNIDFEKVVGFMAEKVKDWQNAKTERLF